MEKIQDLNDHSKDIENLAKKSVETSTYDSTLDTGEKAGNIDVAINSKEKDAKEINILRRGISKFFGKKEIPQEKYDAAHYFFENTAPEKWQDIYKAKDNLGQREMQEKLIKGELFKSVKYVDGQYVVTQGVIGGGM